MNKRRFDVVSLGELLIDFTPYGQSDQGHSVLEVNPGGGPCNVLSMVSSLGGKTAFIGKVGDDHFGHLLAQQVAARAINVDGLVFDKNYFTTLAFVHLDQDGDRSFSFARKPGADIMLTQEEVKMNIITDSLIFHFSTLSMTDEPIRQTIQVAVTEAKAAGTLLSFDPNIRPPLWRSMEEAKEWMHYGFSQCDILKVSEEELYLATGLEEIKPAVQQLLSQYPNIKLIFATLGKEGCYYQMGTKSGNSPAFTVKTIDTTGAGDTFIGTCLYQIAQKGSLNFSLPELEEMAALANAAASLITTRRGALNAVPTLEEIETLLLL